MRRVWVYACATVWIAVMASCDSPRVVDCSPGDFVRVDGEPWCVYGRTGTSRCPSTLPAEHDLPWGGRGCARETFEPLPPGLCAAAGACAGDAGS